MSDAAPRIRIAGGGEPDATERSAILQALTRVLGSRAEHTGVPRSAWALAGRLEGVGMTTVRSPSGLPR